MFFFLNVLFVCMFVYNVLEWVDFYSLIPIYVNIIHVRMNKVIFIPYPLNN